MFFSKIKGHKEVLSNFEKIVLEDSLDSTNLFAGPKGIGKYTIARTLAKYLLCLGVKDDTCRCEYCKQFPYIPDYLEIDSGGMIKVESIELLDNFISLKPFKSKNRIVVINDVDNIHIKAANRLLKIIEDNNSNIIFILTTSFPNKVISTIKSRCCVRDFKMLSPEDIIEILKDKGITLSNIETFRKVIPYVSESILKDGLKYNEYIKSIPSFLKKIVDSKEDDVLMCLDVVQEKEEMLYFVEILILYLNDIFKLKYDSPDILFNTDKLDRIEDLSKNWSGDLCVAFNEKLKKALLDYKKGVNIKLSMRIRPIVMWVYMHMKNELSKKAQNG